MAAARVRLGLLWKGDKLSAGGQRAKDLFEIHDGDDQPAISEKVSARVLALDAALESGLPALLALLDAASDETGRSTETAWRTLTPPQRRRRMLDAVRHLLLRLSRDQPLLLVFEDLHWIDGETQALLDELVDSLGSSRILLLVNYRPEYQHGWASKPYYVQTRLETLPVDNAGQLLDALLGDDPSLAPIKALFIRRGNPFFLEEAVRTLVEMKALDGSPGRYRLVRLVETIQIPGTVQTILAARIDRLPAEEKQLLQVASVIGRHVSFALLQSTTDLPDEVLRGGLDHLQAAEFVYEFELVPGPRIYVQACAHA